MLDVSSPASWDLPHPAPRTGLMTLNFSLTLLLGLTPATSTLSSLTPPPVFCARRHHRICCDANREPELHEERAASQSLGTEELPETFVLIAERMKIDLDS